MQSPTYKHGIYTKKKQLQPLQPLIKYKSLEIALKYTKMTKSKKTSSTRQKFGFRMEPKIITILPISF